MGLSRDAKKGLRRIRFAILVGCAGSTPLYAADAGIPSNEDLRHVRAIAEPQVSPDGSQVLIRVTDATADGGRQHLWLVDVASNTARQLTFSPAVDKSGEHSGRWLGDGRSIVFLAKRTEHVQLFRLPMSGGEAHAFDIKVAPLIDESQEPDAIPPKKAGDPPAPQDPIPLDVEQYEPAPDGRTIAIIAQDPETAGEKKQKDEKADALWVDHEKHGKRLYLLDTESGQLTAVTVASDVTKIAWTKKSDRLIALSEGSNHAGDLGPATSAWLVDPLNPTHPSQLNQLPATTRGGTWSEDGLRFFFRAQAKPDAPPGYDELFALTIEGRSVRSLSTDLGGSLGAEDPVSIGSAALQAVQLGFRRTYLRIGSDGKSEEIHFDRPVVRGLQCSAGAGPCAWLGESGTQAPALYFASQPGAAARVLNTPTLLPAPWESPNVHAIRWKNQGLDIEGMLYLPSQADARVPLIVEVHGGPTGAFVDSFSPMTAYLLAQGWAVLMTNPRGSTGYGATFAAANKNDLGGRDLKDIMAGIDAVVAAYSIDRSKLALMGYS